MANTKKTPKVPTKRDGTKALSQGGRPSKTLKISTIKRVEAGENLVDLSKEIGFSIGTIAKWVATAIPVKEELSAEPVAETTKKEDSKFMEVVARMCLNYDGVDYATGEVFRLKGARNDSILLNIGYIREKTKEDVCFVDDRSGKRFISQAAAYNWHAEQHRKTMAQTDPGALRAYDLDRERRIKRTLGVD